MNPDFTMTSAEDRAARVAVAVESAAEKANAALLMKEAAKVASKMGQTELREHLDRETERLTAQVFNAVFSAESILTQGAGACDPEYNV